MSEMYQNNLGRFQMKRKIFYVTMLAVLFIIMVFYFTTDFIYSQEKTSRIDGVWEGVLEAMGMELRIVVHITREADGALKASMDSPDQGAMGLKVDEVSFKNGTLYFVMDAIGGEYEGKLKEDGLTIDGEWSQGGTTIPLELKKNTAKKPKKVKDRVAIKIDPVLLDAYTGKYEITQNVLITITKVENKLFAQVTGQPSIEVYPESDTKFFYKVADAQITFVKDESGKVTHLVLHQGERDTKAQRTGK